MRIQLEAANLPVNLGCIDRPISSLLIDFGITTDGKLLRDMFDSQTFVFLPLMENFFETCLIPKLLFQRSSALR